MPKTAETSQGGTLALHLGTNVGLCVNGRPQVWVLPRHLDPGCVGVALLDALRDLWKLEQPDRILVTAPLDNIEDGTEASLTVGLVMCIQIFGHGRKVPVELVNVHTVHVAMFDRSDMTARQLKAAVIGLAKRRGLTSADPDAAHALTLFEYGSTKQKAAA